MVEILTDGSPHYLIAAEEEFIGAAINNASDDVLVASVIVQPEDFRDRSLGLIWRAIVDSEAATFPVVCALLDGRGELDGVGGEPRLMDLVTRQSAYLYAGHAALEANAKLIHCYAEKRRNLAIAVEAVKAIHAAPADGGVRIAGLRKTAQ